MISGIQPDLQKKSSVPYFPYDLYTNCSMSQLVERIRQALSRRRQISEKKMFGGHCFFVKGNMIGGVTKDGQLIIRVGKDKYEATLQEPFANQMDFTGRVMRGFVTIDSAGLKDEDGLNYWINKGLTYAKSLPAK